MYLIEQRESEWRIHWAESLWVWLELQSRIPGSVEVMWGKAYSVWMKEVERSRLQEQLEEVWSSSWNKEVESRDCVESLLCSGNSRRDEGKVRWRGGRHRERGVPAELQGGMDGNGVAEHRGSQLLHRCSLQPGPSTPQAQHTDSSHGGFFWLLYFFFKFFFGHPIHVN